MQFELSEALIESILFSMEDQNGKFLLDTLHGVLIRAEEIQPGADQEKKKEIYLPLPKWEPSDGFRLMERFASELRNPLAREELSAALNRGKGVFRSFKDVLSRYPETEKLWFVYKEKKLKQEIIGWYNALREVWGLEQIGSEPEDTEDLVLEDFHFRAGIEADRENAEELHRLCGDEYSAIDPWTFPGNLCMVAETASGDFAACICAILENLALHIHILEVKPEYRGLGLGESLLSRLLEEADKKGISCASIDLPAGIEGFSRALLRASFTPSVQRYCRTTGSGKKDSVY
jgi:ribosomal protein S18 acetylase RimI-like enzyme